MNRILLFIILFLILNLPCVFAVNPTLQYIFPKPGSAFLPIGTEVLIRFNNVDPFQITNLVTFIVLTGDQSGAVSGRTTVLTDHKTIRFLPDVPFKAGETVTMFINPVFQGADEPFLKKTCYFTIYDRPESIDNSAMNKKLPVQKPVFDYAAAGMMAGDPAVLNGVSVPSNFPRMQVLMNNNPAGGYLFVTHGWGTQNSYYMILDNTGAPVWYYYYNGWLMPLNLDLQKNGEITLNAPLPGAPAGGYVSMDNTYTVTHSYRINWNGYYQNDHELVILEDGRSFMIGSRDYNVDLSQTIPGAGTSVNVEETAIFGYPPGSRAPNFIWRAFDHFDIADNDEPEIDEINSRFVRFPHMNALDIDTDGHILLSSRHLSEITKINIETGEIIWRLGGKNNQFTFINDPLNGPSCQHHVRSLGNGRYTVFDNGNQHLPPVSRGVEWELDTEAKTAQLVWEYRNVEPDNQFSNFMGNNQRLPNGNRFINWAQGFFLSKLATEVTGEGVKTFEFTFEENTNAYRVFKYQWDAVALVPYLLAETYTDAVTLIFNKFGDPDIDYYNVYGGTGENPNTVIATSEKPFVHLSHELVNNRRFYFRVTATDRSGQESGFSNEVDVLVNLIEPGQNIVSNGDFENEMSDWVWLVFNGDADYEITDDYMLHLIIRDGGIGSWDIRLLHPGISLINGKKYQFEFDAFSDGERVIFIDIQSNHDPMINYSEIGGTALTQKPAHFFYEFIMEEPSDPEAQIVLDAGADDHDIFIDNVSLKQVSSSRADLVESLPDTPELKQNYPNPFNSTTCINYRIPESGEFSFFIYDISGKLIFSKSVSNSAGRNTIQWRGTDNAGNEVASGVYLYKIQTGNYQKSRKMILLR
ncbi:aryl-sulfate sulfotransferase [bacterium]|nr:aryl-sulfate sulfotransferase [candidate division CSSED10-310 bacterium]